MSLVKMPGNPFKFAGKIGAGIAKAATAPAKAMAAPFKKKPKLGGMGSAIKKVLT